MEGQRPQPAEALERGFHEISRGDPFAVQRGRNAPFALEGIAISTRLLKGKVSK